MQGNTTGYYNVALGGEALLQNSTGYNNVAIGTKALRNNSSGSNNVALGGLYKIIQPDTITLL
jgi:trimeric autotransporter adhesin